MHFLPLDEQRLPGHNVGPILNQYLPIKLTHEEYPALIPEGTSVPTIGNRALLVTYAWPENSQRYNRITKFVNEFFGKIDQFQNGARHPKWREFEATVEIPGWTWFKPAADWVAARKLAMSQANGGVQPGNVQTLFEQYLASAGASGQKPLSDLEREALFAKFQQFLVSRNRQ